MRTGRMALSVLMASGILALCAPLGAQAAPQKPATQKAAPQKAAIINPAAVTRAYEAQFDTAKQFPPTKVAIASGYALQGWSNAQAHGAAIMRYDPQRGWLFVESGDGDWDAPSLAQMGVPEDAAQKLVAMMAELDQPAPQGAAG